MEQFFPCKKKLQQQRNRVAGNFKSGKCPPMLLVRATPCWLKYLLIIVFSGHIPPAPFSSFCFLPPWYSPLLCYKITPFLILSHSASFLSFIIATIEQQIFELGGGINYQLWLQSASALLNFFMWKLIPTKNRSQ